MNRKFYAFLIACLSTCLFFTACSKTGPEGPQGEQGPPGETGAQGEQGAKGDTGTANVIYSGWLDVTYDADTVHNGDAIDTIGFYAGITAQSLTSDIINGGDIHVYFNFGTADEPNVVLLPFLDIYSGISITPSFTINNIFLYANADASTVTDGNVAYYQYRYVLIPGGVSGNAVVHPPDWKDYNAVKAFYHLPD